MKLSVLSLLLAVSPALIFAVSFRLQAASRREDVPLSAVKEDGPLLQDDRDQQLLEEGVIEGDIRVSRGLLDRMRAWGLGRSKRGAVLTSSWKWSTTVEGGKTLVKVPYSSGLSGQSANELKRAVDEMTERTCVRFVLDSNPSGDYVHFKSGSGCSSDIGKMGGKQDIEISSSGCHHKGKILHEMMHALGFFHEQSRSDRDSYVNYKSANVKSGYTGQFAIKSQDTQGLAYDLHSMMHYRKDQFSNGNGNTLEARANANIELGNRNDFSALDIKRINLLYGCSEVNDGYKDYYVTVTTGSSWVGGDGTNEFVYIQLQGTSGTSKRCDVATGGNIDDFESGSTQNFFVACSNVGTIQQLKVELVNNPNDYWNDGWTLDKVVIKDKISSSQMKKYVFDANSAGLEPGESVTLSPSTSTVSLESGIWTT